MRTRETILGNKRGESPVVEVSCACCFFDETKPAGDVLNQHSQQNHQPEGPERTKINNEMCSEVKTERNTT